MSDEPSGSEEVPPQPPPEAPEPPTAPRARIARRRRLTAIPIEPDSGAPPSNDVRRLRPGEVPQREPLPDYVPPVLNQNIVPKNVSIDRLSEYDLHDTLDVTISTATSSDVLVEEAHKKKETVSFRNTNYLDPSIILKEEQEPEIDVVGEGSAPLGWTEILDFVKRSKEFIDNEYCGCVTKVFRYDYENTVSNGSTRLLPKRPRITHFGGKSDSWRDGILENSTTLVLHVTMNGPPGSLYEGGTYFLKIFLNINQIDMCVIPQIRFETMMFNPSLSRHGMYDNRSLLKNRWTKKSTLGVLLNWLTSEMTNLKDDIFKMTVEERRQMSQPNISTMAFEHWKRFEKITKDLVIKMASGGGREYHTVVSKMSNKYSKTRGWAAPDEDDDVDVVG